MCEMGQMGQIGFSDYTEIRPYFVFELGWRIGVIDSDHHHWSFDSFQSLFVFSLFVFCFVFEFESDFL